MRKLLLLVPLILACSSTPSAKTTIPPAPGGDLCDAAEKHLLELQCKDRRDRLIGGPTLRDKPWRDVCHEDTSNGVDMKTDCLVKAVDCNGVEQCR